MKIVKNNKQAELDDKYSSCINTGIGAWKGGNVIHLVTSYGGSKFAIKVITCKSTKILEEITGASLGQAIKRFTEVAMSKGFCVNLANQPKPKLFFAHPTSIAGTRGWEWAVSSFMPNGRWVSTIDSHENSRTPFTKKEAQAKAKALRRKQAKKLNAVRV